MKFNNKKKAQSLVEYALILALVTIVAITALQFLGKKVNDSVQGVGGTIETQTEDAAKNYCEALGTGYGWNDGKCEAPDDSGTTTP